MSATFLPAIDIPSYITISPYSGRSKGLSLTDLKHIGHIFATVSDETLDTTLEHLHQTFNLFSSYLDVTSLQSTENVVSLLDSGAAKVFVSRQQLGELSKVGNLDPSRLVLQVSDTTKQEGSSQISSGPTAAILVSGIKDASFVESMVQSRKTDESPVFVSFAEPVPNEQLVLAIAKLKVIPIVSADLLTVDAKANPESISVANLLLAGATTDRSDGLFTTLVTDERGVALGLVYSSTESVAESLRTGRGVYQSRKRGIWYKGETSGDVQELVKISLDCDKDCLLFVVEQQGRGFCHLATSTCFGNYSGLSKLQKTLESRKSSAPVGSYTARLFNDPELLKAKIMEEASELCDAEDPQEIAFEAADVMYFALTKCIAAGVSLKDVEQNLDAKSIKVKRRKGDTKGPWVAQAQQKQTSGAENTTAPKDQIKEKVDQSSRIQLKRYDTSKNSSDDIQEALKRPSQRSSEKVMGIVDPIIKDIQERGDVALLEYTHKFEKAISLTSPVLKAPFNQSLMQLHPDTIEAIDTSFENIRKFHAAQKEEKPLQVETMPGVVCSRFARPIERVGLYVPGGTAVLPSTALMLGVPAMVAGCKKIVFASPPRADGSITPEIVYIAQKVGAESIVLAGGAQAVAAMAYGTQSVSKVDKILGPGNQFVTAAKMFVSNDTSAAVGIDMPAGPSEVLVIADETAEPAFVAADLLSQAEHGVDSQVVLVAVGLTDGQLEAIEDQVHEQASALPRVEIVRVAIEHSVTLQVKTVEEAMQLSNMYAPEHLILQVKTPEAVVDLVQNAGSVFIGPWTPESVGDYSAGVNHSLPTYGYARQYSGVNLGSYVKHITSSNLSAQGLKNVGGAVMQLAKVEELEAHRRAVSIRLDHLNRKTAKVS